MSVPKEDRMQETKASIELKATFGQRVRALRQSHGESQIACARGAGTTQSILSQIESGAPNRRLHHILIAQFAEHFRVDPWVLLTPLDYKPVTRKKPRARKVAR